MGNGGLSPRVRGNPYLPAQPADGLRSIPACAGKPTAGELSPNPMTVYPRVCGETAQLGDSGYGWRVYPRVCGETTFVAGPRRE